MSDNGHVNGAIWDPRAERAVLGGVLIDPAVIAEALPLEPSDFYRDPHRLIWASMVRLYRAGEAITVATVAADLGTHGQLDQAGGPLELHRLLSEEGWRFSAAHADLIRRTASVRSAVGVLRQAEIALSQVATDRDQIDRAMGRANRQWQETMRGLVTESEASGYRHIRVECEAIAADRQRGDGTASALELGVECLAGLGDLPVGAPTIVGGLTGHGKTAFADLVLRTFARRGVRGHRFDLEDPSRRTTERFVVQTLAEETAGGRHLSVRELRRIVSGDWDDATAAEWWDRVESTMAEVSEMPITVEDSGGLSAEDIRLRMRLVRDEVGGAPLVQVVDHVLEVDHPGLNERVELNRILRTLRAGVRETQSVGLLLGQVRRQESRKLPKESKLAEAMRRRPSISDLQETGAWEQTGRLIWLVFRPEADVQWGRRLTWTHPMEVTAGKATDDAPQHTAYLMFEPAGVLLRPPTTVEAEVIEESRAEDRWFHEIWESLPETRLARHRWQLQSWRPGTLKAPKEREIEREDCTPF